jgi:CheY-like chemotaxis protein
VQLRVKLPDGEEVETVAEVAHVVSPEEASARGLAAGVGLSFREVRPEFREPIERLIAEYKARRPRVLAIDDDALFRTMLVDQLTAAGMEVEVCANGADGLRRLLEVFNELDLLIIDLNMPDMDGRDLLHRIRRVGGESDLRVMVLSSSSEEELQRFVSREGANAAISKNIGLPAMIERIKRVLGR